MIESIPQVARVLHPTHRDPSSDKTSALLSSTSPQEALRHRMSLCWKEH